jgi:hypothetical protein
VIPLSIMEGPHITPAPMIAFILFILFIIFSLTFF